MFSDPNYIKNCEALVLEVDTLRKSCKCVSDKGQVFTNVGWVEVSGGNSRAGSYRTPKFGDKVLICVSTGSPMILGMKPDPYEHTAIKPSQIVDGEGYVETTDLGDFSAFDVANLQVNQSSPRDAKVSDHIITNEEGSMWAFLNSGTIISKASALAQIVVSKWDDLVRIVARKMETFTDSHSEFNLNIKNNIYNFKGYSDTHKNIREERYKYFETTGDAYTGEKVQGNYHDKDVAAIADNKPDDPWIIRTYAVQEFEEGADTGYDETSKYRMYETLRLDGNLTRVVSNADGDVKVTYDVTELHNYTEALTSDSKSFIEQIGNQLHVNIEKSGKTNDWQWNENGTVLDWDGKAIIKKNATGIEINWKGQDIITLTDSGIVLDRNGTSKVILTDSSATTESNGHKVVINGSGIHMS